MPTRYEYVEGATAGRHVTRIKLGRIVVFLAADDRRKKRMFWNAWRRVVTRTYSQSGALASRWSRCHRNGHRSCDGLTGRVVMPRS
jgi:hypothetical protein